MKKTIINTAIMAVLSIGSLFAQNISTFPNTTSTFPSTIPNTSTNNGNMNYGSVPTSTLPGTMGTNNINTQSGYGSTNGMNGSMAIPGSVTPGIAPNSAGGTNLYQNNNSGMYSNQSGYGNTYGTGGSSILPGSSTIPSSTLPGNNFGTGASQNSFGTGSLPNNGLNNSGGSFVIPNNSSSGFGSGNTNTGFGTRSNSF